MINMRCVLSLFSLLELFVASNSFIFDTSNVTSVSPVIHTAKQTPVSTIVPQGNSKQTHRSGNATLAPTPFPDKDYHQLLNILMEERRARIQVEQQLIELETNVSDVFASFEMTLNNTDGVEKQVVDFERKYNESVTVLKKNVSDLNAVQRDLEAQCYNKTYMIVETNITHQLHNLSVEAETVRDALLSVKNKTGLQSGFTVTRPTNGPRPGTITFQTVITNLHDGYNITNGEFICDVSGVYFFILSLYKFSLADFAYCSIRHNGTDVMEAYSNPNTHGDFGFYSASTTLFVHLESGDTIDLGHCTDAGTMNYRTTFTGFLVNAD